MDEMSSKDMLELAKELIEHLEDSDVDVNVEVRSTHSRAIAITVVFFDGSDVFSVNLYSFYSQDKNRELLECCIKLIDDKKLYEYIKNEIKKEAL